MKKRVLDYMKVIDDILTDEKGDYDYEEIRKEHLVQLQFFMHERHMHLLVMLTFALFAFGTFGLMFMSFQPSLLLLMLAVFVLLVPYILHYFLLENSVQKMYEQYDALYQKCLATRKKEQN